MSKVVLDASALLALINQEPGAEVVENSLSEAMISAVNVSEVATVLHSIGMPMSEIKALIEALIPNIIPLEEQQALLVAELREKTKSKGLSLGDRACLALGILKKLPVLTADKVWGELSLPAKIHVIR